MLNMNTSDRIIRRMADLGINQAELVKLVGTSKGSVSQWVNGKGSPKGENLLKLANALECNPKWLISGQGEQAAGIQPPPRMVPVISSVKAGDWDEPIDNFCPGHAERYLPCAKQHSDSAFALVVDGDSMTSPTGRTYPEGSIIFVDPELRGGVGTGDRVVAKVKGKSDVVFKQLAKDGGNFYLKPLNPQHPPLFDEFRILGKVIGMWVDE